MKHNFNLIPDRYNHTINNKYLTIIIDDNYISIDLNLISSIDDEINVVNIKVVTNDICIWYTLYKKITFIHCSVINLLAN